MTVQSNQGAGRVADATRHTDKVEGLAEELKKMEWEPLQPIEKKLIGWSIGLGVCLLGILLWVSTTFFPSGH
jgi:hypothetical protein